MNTKVKKVIFYSIVVGLTQFALNASSLEASPRDDWNQQHNDQVLQESQQHDREMQRHDNENEAAWNERKRIETERHERFALQDNERQYRNELELERHEHELERHENESWQDWNDRQWVENQRHQQAIQQIEADVVLLFLNR